MWHKEKDIHQKGQQGDKQGWKKENEKRKKVSRRVRWRVKMSSACQAETYQVKECGDRMDDQKAGEGMASGGGKAKAGVLVCISKESIWAI